MVLTKEWAHKSIKQNRESKYRPIYKLQLIFEKSTSQFSDKRLVFPLVVLRHFFINNQKNKP